MDTRDFHEPRVPARYSPRLTPAPLKESAPPARTAPVLSLRVILRGIARYWWQILAVWIIGSTSLAALVYTSVKPQYEATSVLQVEAATQELFPGVSFNTGPSAGTYLETQRQLVLSNAILQAVAADPEVAKTDKLRKAGGTDPKDVLRKSLQVDVVPGTILIKVVMRSPLPVEAALIVNKVVEIFIETQSDRNSDVTRAQIKRLGDEAQKQKAQLDELEQQWRELVAKSQMEPGMVEPSRKAAEGEEKANSGKLSLEEYRSVRHQLIQNSMELIQAEVILAKRQKDPVGADPRAELVHQIEDRLATDPDLIRAREEIQKARENLAAAKRLTKGSMYDPAVKKSTQRLTDASTKYQLLKELKEQAHRANLASAPIHDSGQPLRAARERVDLLRATRDGLEQALKQVDDSQRKNATTAVDVQIITQQREGIRETLLAYSKRKEQLEFEAQNVARFTQIDKAFIPGVPISDRRLKMMAAIPLGLLGGLLGLAVLAELRSGRVSHPDELTSLVPVEVFAIPPLPINRLESRNHTQAELIEVYAQRLDHLRVALGIDTGTAQLGRCVMITSASGGEGKTTLAAQLGGRCATAGIRTLLIDADLRRATLSRLLDVPQGPGLVNVLSGASEVAEVVVSIDTGGSLHLLPAGMSGLDAGRVLHGPELGQILEHLRQEFELILIDTPPVLPVADALTVGQWVDGSLIAVRSDTSRFNFVGRATRMLASARIPVLGVVVNGVRCEESYADYAYRNVRTSASASSAMADDPGPEPDAPL
jgi:capsular exopolysaccharide synthesis family protein